MYSPRHSGNRCNECCGGTRYHASAQGGIAGEDGGGSQDDGHPKGEPGAGITGDRKAITTWAG